MPKSHKIYKKNETQYIYGKTYPIQNSFRYCVSVPPAFFTKHCLCITGGTKEPFTESQLHHWEFAEISKFPALGTISGRVKIDTGMRIMND